MLIEVPESGVVFGWIVAFLVGFFGLYIYYKVRPYISLQKVGEEPGRSERLEYYENQMIDMKIRLDAIELGDSGGEDAGPAKVVTEVVESDINNIRKNTKKTPENVEKIRKDVQKQQKRLPNMASSNLTDYVLRLITNKQMTSRDIQITLGRSREHTSRLMKRLSDEGYVLRHTDTKPFNYSITDMGRERVGVSKDPATPT